MTDENTSVHNPHDSFFKSLMHNRETALAFLEEFLPDEVKDVLDLQSLELANTTFLTDELKQYFSDIVFKLK
ncbi:MAG TPA: Rpn family recombination-promoting nuclease/putative transposase, partial [Saprospiraceae bacterium]|nr:Rpn family recombination-promoting nuclease/putative transposase [Saprospiraceae bacterium]